MEKYLLNLVVVKIEMKEGKMKSTKLNLIRLNGSRTHWHGIIEYPLIESQTKFKCLLLSK